MKKASRASLNNQQEAIVHKYTTKNSRGQSRLIEPFVGDRRRRRKTEEEEERRRSSPVEAFLLKVTFFFLQ